MSLIEVKELSKKYSDEFSLSDISFNIESKGMYAFLGKHGSGKSALAGVLAGVECPDSGCVLYKDQEMFASEKKTANIKNKLSFVAQDYQFDKKMTAFEILDFVGSAKGVDPDKRFRQIKEALELTELTAVSGVLWVSLSLSQKKRLSIAAALLGNPDVIILDEPLAGFERSQAGEVKKLLTMLANKKVILLFTARPADVEELCSTVAIMHGGKIMLWDSVASILETLKSDGIVGLSAALDAFSADVVADIKISESAREDE